MQINSINPHNQAFSGRIINLNKCPWTRDIVEMAMPELEKIVKPSKHDIVIKSGGGYMSAVRMGLYNPGCPEKDDFLTLVDTPLATPKSSAQTLISRVKYYLEEIAPRLKR